MRYEVFKPKHCLCLQTLIVPSDGCYGVAIITICEEAKVWELSAAGVPFKENHHCSNCCYEAGENTKQILISYYIMLYYIILYYIILCYTLKTYNSNSFRNHVVEFSMKSFMHRDYKS